MRPRRQIAWVDGKGFTITDSDQYTQDWDLAVKIRSELDRVDPLPCPHMGDKVDITSMGEPLRSQIMCNDCGEERREDEW